MRIVIAAALVLIALLLVAGCSSSSTAPTPAPQTSVPYTSSIIQDRTVTTVPTTKATTPAGPDLRLDIVSHDWKRTGESTWKAVYVVGSAKNTGWKSIDYGTIYVKWYDKAGNVLGTTANTFTKLNPGETYRFEIMYIGDTDESEVDRYTVLPGDLDHYNL